MNEPTPTERVKKLMYRERETEPGSTVVPAQVARGIATELEQCQAKLAKARELIDAAEKMVEAIKSANTDLYYAAYDRL